MDNYYSKDSSRADVSDYWAYENKRRANMDFVYNSLGEPVGEYLFNKYSGGLPKTKPPVGSFTPSISGKEVWSNPKYKVDNFLPSQASGIAQSTPSPNAMGGLEKGGLLDIASKGLSGAGNLATKAGMAKTGGLLTGAGAKVAGANAWASGALAGMGPVGWALLGGALLTGGSYLLNKNKSTNRYGV